MNMEDFEIGQDFYYYTILCRCTDKGTRTVSSIMLNKDDESWYNGPPYAISEHLLDENDRVCCSKTLEEAKERWGGMNG